VLAVTTIGAGAGVFFRIAVTPGDDVRIGLGDGSGGTMTIRQPAR
jgi:hypothetical protein